MGRISQGAMCGDIQASVPAHWRISQGGDSIRLARSAPPSKLALHPWIAVATRLGKLRISQGGTVFTLRGVPGE
jgi:hypothetical protein